MQLKPDQALEFLQTHKTFFDRVCGLTGGVDPFVLAHGFDQSGALIVEGSRQPSFDSKDFTSSVFINGDLTVDTYFSTSGLIFISGNLKARALYNNGMLVVLGDVVAERVFCSDEHGGTTIGGDLKVEDYCLAWNHMDLIEGKTNCKNIFSYQCPLTSPNFSELIRTWQIEPDGEHIFSAKKVIKALQEWSKT